MAAEPTSSSRSGFIAEKVTAMDGPAKGLGTLTGVFMPTMQNITGVLLFLRLPWITGQAGILLSLAIVACAVGTTIPTALSMSAIAVRAAHWALRHAIWCSAGPAGVRAAARATAAAEPR